MINQKDYFQESKLNVKLDGANNSSFYEISKKIDSTFIIDEFNDSQENYLEYQKEQKVEISDNQNEQIQQQSSSSQVNYSSNAENNYDDDIAENNENHEKQKNFQQKTDTKLANNFSIFDTLMKNHKKNGDIEVKQYNQQPQYKKCCTVNSPLNISKKQVVTASSYKSRISQKQFIINF
ncbi:cyclic nucleotide-binding domain protein (macronuclear) [Tetrahymena thermophila SB210]|uniref:Cyclic nucleotide-binding domain protein n=1 Tax=Tetrahymena thermophila (strain SB210) TaxID=312017 RepID=W7XFZ6_TETTS|nr:cyclic nucleotide-binding domain protein [Tetrahymena thermophila SB210]EWS71774.1 cyclic nucleotide-binding domain protein [Tetrahymena thermophila SB210]|eukprot:XP_012655661.1 cyclic nucleotide-binding domain protein [Tetrahymena thermophila SB210]